MLPPLQGKCQQHRKWLRGTAPRTVLSVIHLSFPETGLPTVVTMMANISRMFYGLRLPEHLCRVPPVTMIPAHCYPLAHMLGTAPHGCAPILLLVSPWATPGPILTSRGPPFLSFHTPATVSDPRPALLPRLPQFSSYLRSLPAITLRASLLPLFSLPCTTRGAPWASSALTANCSPGLVSTYQTSDSLEVLLILQT